MKVKKILDVLCNFERKEFVFKFIDHSTWDVIIDITWSLFDAYGDK